MVVSDEVCARRVLGAQRDESALLTQQRHGCDQCGSASCTDEERLAGVGLLLSGPAEEAQ